MPNIDKIIEKVALEKQEDISIPSNMLDELVEKIEEKYFGTFSVFVFGGTAHVMRDSKKPMKLR